MVEQLVYVSRASPAIGDRPDAAMRSLYDIIRVSHNRNSQYGLTGALIFLDGYFLQVLEGDAHDLQARFQVIQADLRHTDVSVRQSVTMNERAFPDEWMALRDASLIHDELKLDFGYLPGFPATQFSGEKLVKFALACCQPFRGTQSGLL